MLINEENQAIIKERFAPMQGEVVIQYFESSLDCPTCGEIKQLLEEVVHLSDLLSLEVTNFHIEQDKVKELGIDRVPAFNITDASRKNYGIHFYGAPSGYEFATLLEDILMVSQGESGLQDGTKESLAGLTQPVNLNVFVTPTCPYCPRAVRLAHQFAFESGLVQGAMVEATEFPEWSNEFNVYGVPKTVINDSDALSLEGAVPEPALLEKVLEAVR
ncbi:glutaredoxin [Alicyclobacillaceae bacterium I2511]|nr:glutaredoxin [Alicyclobacillaceae bacterium I2511]